MGAGRQLQHAVEHAVASLAELNVLVLLVFFHLLLPADRERIVLDGYLDVLALKPRHLRADLDCLVRFGDFDVGDNIRTVRTYSLRELAEQAIDLSMQTEQSEIGSH